MPSGENAKHLLIKGPQWVFDSLMNETMIPALQRIENSQYGHCVL